MLTWCSLGTIGAPLGWVAVGLVCFESLMQRSMLTVQLLIRFAYCLWQVTFQLSARQNRLGQLDLAVSRTETGDDTHGLNVYSKSDI